VKKFVFLMALLAACLVLGLAEAQAEIAGRFTEVEGRVDVLKGGSLPASPVQVGHTVASKDVIRTKSLSKAQITFIDNSVLTISPQSRVAIEEYMVDTAQGKRRAVMEVFQGLALAVVNKIFKVEEPDFIVKTQTAIMGVRGTEFGVRIQPNGSTIMNFEGRLQVGNIFPEISRLFLKAFKVAYSFQASPDGAQRWVFLNRMQGTFVGRELPPTLPITITAQDKKIFMQQLKVGPVSRKAGLSRYAEEVTDSEESDEVSKSLPSLATSNLIQFYTPPSLRPQTQSAAPSPSSTPGVVPGVVNPEGSVPGQVVPQNPVIPPTPGGVTNVPGVVPSTGR
jgi:hypothetical protein